MGKKLILGLMIGTLAIAFGCAKDQPQATTPASLETYDFPIGSTDVAAGQDVFAEFCEGCHPGGEEGDGPSLVDQAVSPSQMRWKVRTGGDDMPAFDPDKISNENLESLLAYALTIGAVSQ